jgi:hypothetical protein
MSAARPAPRSAAAAEVAWVVVHHALPGWLLTALSTTLRVPMLVGAASALLGAAAGLTAIVHLAVRLAPEITVPALILVLAVGPLARVAIGETSPLVASVAAVAPLLRALELGRGRGWGALAAIAPLLLGSSAVAGAAALSLSTAGDARSAVVVIASAGGLAAAGAAAALRDGRPLLADVPVRIAGALMLGAAGWAVLAAEPLAVGLRAPVTVGALGTVGDAVAAASTPLVLVIAAAPAAWVAGELLARDARPLVRLVRELVSCGAPAAAPAAALAGAMLSIGAASAVVLLEPASERVAARAVVFALLLTPPFLVATGAVGSAWLPAVGVAITAVAVAMTTGGPR